MKTMMGAMVVAALMLSGCGTPSKGDVCGDCTDSVKEVCEQTYDLCEDDDDCIDALEELCE